MTTSDLKLELIRQIIESNDIELLLEINALLNEKNDAEFEENLSIVNEPSATYEKASSEKVYVFNEWQQKRIDIALKQIENGEYLTEEEAEKEIQLWFKEEEERLSGQ